MMGAYEEDWTCYAPVQSLGLVCMAIGVAFTIVWLRTSWRFGRNLWNLHRTGSESISEMRRKQQGLAPITDRSKLPRVSVVLPVKGVHSKTLSNWEHQLASTHGGKVEFIFCMESRDDPAYSAMKEFRDVSGHAEKIKIVVAGFAFHCSQKIHNLLEGVKHVSDRSDYVLFLDDDAEMKPAIMQDMIWHLEKDPEVMVVTGYPHEYVSPRTVGSGVSFASTMLLAYRKMAFLNIALEHPPALWGGCLMMRREELLDPKIGVLTSWKAQGYSDDMIMSGRVQRNRRKSCHPTTCVLTTEVDPGYSLKQHLNFVRRQMFVLDTYSDLTDNIGNHIILILVCIITLSLCLSFQLLSLLAAMRVVQRVSSPPEGGLRFGLDQGQAACGLFPFPPILLELLLASVCIAWHISSFVCEDMVNRTCQYMSQKPDDYYKSKYSLKMHAVCFVGFMFQLFVQASYAVITLMTDSIVWSGVRYVRKGGKVVQVWRVGNDGKEYTVPAHISMEKTMTMKSVAE